MIPSDDPPTMTVPELAARIGVDESTAYRYLRAGKLPGVQAGNSWIIDRGRVERFVAGQEDAQGRPLVAAPTTMAGPRLTLVPEREPVTAELAQSWLRGARAVLEMVFAAGDSRAPENAAAEHHTVSA